MIINKSGIKIAATDLLLIIVSAVFLIGIRTWFAVCEPSSEMYMSCHWAGEALKSLSIFFCIISILHIFIPDGKVKAGLSISLVAAAAYSFLLPGTTIALCKMPEMACRSNTSLWNTILMALLAASAIADIILYYSVITKDKHKRSKEKKSNDKK